jgi:hypothetical protein
MLIEKNSGPEIKWISFYTQRLENGKWQPFMSPPDVAGQGRWTVRNAGKSFSLSHPAMDWKSPYAYRVNAANGIFTIDIADKAACPPDIIRIDIADKDARPLDSIRLDFVAGKWIVR